MSLVADCESQSGSQRQGTIDCLLTDDDIAACEKRTSKEWKTLAAEYINATSDMKCLCCGLLYCDDVFDKIESTSGAVILTRACALLLTLAVI